MHKVAALSLASSAVLCLGLVSCSDSAKDLPLATGTVAHASAEQTQRLYAEAYGYESTQRFSKAAKAYRDLADDFPLAKEAPEARFRQADILYRQGELLKSFKAYQAFITRYYGTKLYSTALERQAEVAHAAATGDIKHNFLGLKSRVAPSQVQEMLEQVRDNAPYSDEAARAQFAIGTMWEQRKDYTKAIAAYAKVQPKYPKSKYAPEALFRVGNLLMAEKDKGNRNAANLDTARNTFIDLRQLYASSPQAKAAKAKLNAIESADVQRSYEIAQFYQQKKQNASAAFYYREVLRKTPKGSALHLKAQQGLAAVSQ